MTTIPANESSSLIAVSRKSLYDGAINFDLLAKRVEALAKNKGGNPLTVLRDVRAYAASLATKKSCTPNTDDDFTRFGATRTLAARCFRLSDSLLSASGAAGVGNAQRAALGALAGDFLRRGQALAAGVRALVSEHPSYDQGDLAELQKSAARLEGSSRVAPGAAPPPPRATGVCLRRR